MLGMSSNIAIPIDTCMDTIYDKGSDMADSKGSGMTTIKIRPSTQVRIRDFADGLGATYDRMVNFLLDEIKQGKEDDIDAGVRLRMKYKASAAATGDDDKEAGKRTSRK